MSKINEGPLDRLRQLAGLSSKPERKAAPTPAADTTNLLVASVKVYDLKPKYVRVASDDVVTALMAVNQTVGQILNNVAKHYHEDPAEYSNNVRNPFDAKMIKVTPESASKVSSLKELTLEKVQELDASLKRMWDEHDLADGWEIVVDGGHILEHAIKMVIHDFADDYIDSNSFKRGQHIISYSV